jgi:hypothetical protein
VICLLHQRFEIGHPPIKIFTDGSQASFLEIVQR